MKSGISAFLVGVLVAVFGAVFFNSRIWRLAAIASANSAPHTITYVDFLTVTLTALCALLATVALGIAAAAIVGYRDIKSSVVNVINSVASDAIAKKLMEYPDAAALNTRFTALAQEMETKARLSADLLKLLSGAPDEASPVAKASKTKQNEAGKTQSPPRYPKPGKGA